MSGKVSFLVLLLVLFFGAFFFGKNIASNRPVFADNDKVNLCHLTSSQTNPWVVQSVDANEVQSHIGNGDFYYTGNCSNGPSKNTCQSNWCNNNQPGDKCANIDDKQSSVPDGDHQVGNNCYPVAGTCPTACGQAASTVPDGNGGTTQCSATAACVTDVCANIDGIQASVPEGDYASDGNCYPKTGVCNDESANNYQNLTSRTYANNNLCTYDTQTYCSDGENIQVPVNQDPPEDATLGECVVDEPTPVASPTPTPTPLSCSGTQHLNADKSQCVDYQFGGPPQGGSSSGGQVLGASTVAGQVLGASTMAKTGGFEESLYEFIMGLGGIFTFKGVKSFKKTKQVSKKRK